MKAWEDYMLADKDVHTFETEHEAKRKALIVLGATLTKGGWGSVCFVDPTARTEIGQHLRSDLTTINSRDLEFGGDVKTIVEKYHALLGRRQAAFVALPQSLQEKLDVPGQPQSR